MTDHLAQARERSNDWLTLTQQIVDIDSGPGDHDGVSEVYDVLQSRLAVLGFSFRCLPTEGPDVFVARRHAENGPRLALIGHADTVFPKGTPDRRPFSRDGDLLRGPGVADMKAGLVVAVAGLELADPSTLDRLDISVVVNGDEESGSAQSRDTITDLAPEFDAALVFEPGRPPNQIVSSRRGAHRFNIVVSGRAAHTGVNPHEGANAIETIAHHVLAVQQLGREIPGATVTAVMLSGGSRPNIVPESAVLRVDSRFDTREAEERVISGVRALAGEGPVPDTKTEVHSLDRRPPFLAAAESLMEQCREVGAEMGMTITSEPTGGSSDGNFTSAAGVPTIDGLGAVGSGFHTEDESVIADSVHERAALFAGLLDRMAVDGR